jgi:alpha-tubulin suppressor-like RCC1 family protein
MPVETLRNARICQVCAGDTHVAAVDTNGNLYTWGGNEEGQVSAPHLISTEIDKLPILMLM